MNFYLKHEFFLIYFKIPYDFMILQFVFTIRVYFVFSVPCQNHNFNNLIPTRVQLNLYLFNSNDRKKLIRK